MVHPLSVRPGPPHRNARSRRTSSLVVRGNSLQIGGNFEVVGVDFELLYAVFLDSITAAESDFGFSLLHPRRSGDANVLGANDRAHLHGYANDPGGNDRTLNPGRNLARNRNRDGDGGRKKETENPGLGGFLTT